MDRCVEANVNSLFVRTISFSSLGLAVLGNAACSGGGPAAKQNLVVDAAGAAGAPSEPKPTKGKSSGSGGSAGGSDPSFDSAEGSAGMAGAAGGEGVDSEPACVPQEDKPDNDFADTNCDGIDGDASRAVFVDSHASDEGTGTMDDPVQTLGRALELASEQEKDVYVCNGKYTENLVIEHALGVYGGYDCDNGWHRVADRVSVEPEAGVPLSVIEVEGAVIIERFAFRAPPGLETGASSQAGRILDSTDVSLSRVELRAGSGAAGARGKDGRLHEVEQAPSGADGTDAVLASCKMRNTLSEDCLKAAPGGALPATQCSDSYGPYRPQGGLGGPGGNASLAGVTCGETASGSVGQAGVPASSSLNGAAGRAPTDGVTSTQGFGSLLEGLYQATNAGTEGTPGYRGYSGRGGQGGPSVVSFTNQGFCEGDFSRGGGGGQGGFGGCAGYPGTPGGAGGGSIGLVIVNSQVALDWSSVVTSHGGDGGPGGTGAPGQRGGDPGKGGMGSTSAGTTLTSNQGQAGGWGGDGSRGGHGGAGAGGPSIGIAVVGSDPLLSDCTFNLGLPGRGGDAAVGPAAADGDNAEVYPLAD